MSCMLHGITVLLHERHEVGVDPFGAPVFEEKLVPVDNVLIQPGTTTVNDTDTETSLYGKRALYTLAIPKGDTHCWEDTEVDFFGQTYRTIGYSVLGIEEMIPLDWNRKVTVERYQGGANERL